MATIAVVRDGTDRLALAVGVWLPAGLIFFGPAVVIALRRAARRREE